MAVYKVPQDVEAEDKLLGPFSFRQFIYLLVAGLGIFISYVLSRIFIGLFIIPIPFVLALLALALPLKKDQPMETYLIAMIKFFFKPRIRRWDPEGTMSLFQITALKVADGPTLKEYGGEEASQRLAYLAQVVDSHGWSTRGAIPDGNGIGAMAIEAQKMPDPMDMTSGIAQSFDQKIADANSQRMQAARQLTHASIPQQNPVTSVAGQSPAAETSSIKNSSSDQSPSTQSNVNASVRNRPSDQTNQKRSSSKSVEPPHTRTDAASEYAKHLQQKQSTIQEEVIETHDKKTAHEPSAPTASPDIIRLANNDDLSISAIAREAHRLSDEPNQEVEIPLR